MRGALLVAVLALSSACGGTTEPGGDERDPCRNVRLLGWSRIEADENLTPRLGTAPTTVWTGSELLVWTAALPIMPAPGAPGAGLRWLPATGVVDAIARENAPWLYTTHYATWSGSEMLVWNGEPGGGRYDPAADRWSPMADAPLENLFWGANAWLGDEWFVWGGSYTVVGEYDVASGGSREGATYDPRTDRWRPISTEGAPLHGKSSGVWTGREVVVVGSPDTLARGVERAVAARYDPALDRWSPVAELDLPHGDEPRAIAWTGTEVLVYLYQEENAWGAYDPAAESWRLLPTDGAPRGFVNATWSGRRLVAFGWSDRPRVVGAAYDPAADSWSPLPDDECAPEIDPLPEATSATWIDVGAVLWGGGEAGSEGGWFLSMPP